ncbi:MAG: hypothetical protein HYX20_01455 [Candidatus Yanofskybacteria bacterium]|nr:hypothetical protein [Candidatus Yanofskybacteria bacterium]
MELLVAGFWYLVSGKDLNQQLETSNQLLVVTPEAPVNDGDNYNRRFCYRQQAVGKQEGDYKI